MARRRTASGQREQGFLNIVNNARQAMEGFRPDARLEAVTERAGDKIRILFSDNGPGISAENLAKIFDPFFTTKEVGKGTGLGLSLSYGIIQEHGGTVHVESKVGEGATFVIELPVGTPAEGDSAPDEVTDTTFTKHSNEGFGKRILVIDDEEAVALLVRGALTRRGYSVDTVSDGEAGLRRVAQTKYDLIVCDWKMPGLNGQQVFERLQAEHPQIVNRVIFMTGDVINERTQQFFRESGATCIAKPFSLAEFGATVKKMSRA